MDNRRDLKYSDWQEVVADLDQLLLGYCKHGQWDLTQTAKHLNDWLGFPMDGFPQAALPVRLMMSAVRVTVGKSMLEKTISTASMKDGTPTVPETTHPPGDAQQAVEAVDRLKSTIERFQRYEGAIHRSPIFGDMDKSTAQQLQLVHFAHHLSWLEPKPTLKS